jgi:lysozyme
LTSATDKVRALIRLHEGVRQVAYKDSLGLLTIGIGHLLNAVRDARLPEGLRDAVAKRRLTSAQVDELFAIDLDEHEQALLQYYPWVAELDEVRKAVLIDMAFNMGPAFLAGWPNFVRQLQAGMWHQAASNMRGTRWAKQVKGRAERLAVMMETGQWPPDVLADA